ncbi:MULTISPECIES: site-specific integrase [Bacillus]|uniref:Integrase n=2 Tax=Bacillus TaxID=1386 RepID=A0A0M4FN41_9BACI|nr:MULTISPECIES: site-specific integrase [Bacillus]ALC83929.1 integrase [Bacillus gobiensis]MBP1083003.1 integrase [Bacillus capparidis]MED1098023.1 site-specific integrase [Bacillus capparidis]
MAYYRKIPAKNKKGYTYSFTIELGRDPITKKRKQITRRGFATKREAEKVANEIENQINKDTYIVDSKMTLKEYLNKWLDLAAKRKVRDTTFTNYKRAIDYRVIPVLGHFQLSELKSTHYEQFINSLLQDGLSDRYIEYIYTVLYGALEKAVDWELIIKNPLKKVDIPRGRRRKTITWSREELNRFLGHAKFGDITYYMAFKLDAYTGLRRGELLGLKWSDVDFSENRINVSRSLIYDKQGFRFGPVKTEKSERSVKVDKKVMEELRSYKAKQSELKIAIRSEYDDQNLIFARKDGPPIYFRTFTTIFNRIIKEANVPKIRVHDIRHTHATLMLEAGASLKDVQERLGHTSIQMTGDIYAHVTPVMQEKSSQAFSDYLEEKS